MLPFISYGMKNETEDHFFGNLLHVGPTEDPLYEFYSSKDEGSSMDTSDLRNQQ